MDPEKPGETAFGLKLFLKEKKRKREHQGSRRLEASSYDLKWWKPRVRLFVDSTISKILSCISHAEDSGSPCSALGG
jgi:hypothetical protein